VLAGLAAGVPLLPEEGAPSAALTSALDLGVLVAARSVSSPHTIHPDAGLPALTALTRDAGLRFAPPLSDVIPASEG
ncbi:MAG: hypothetical protein ACM3OO_13235, partial [Planctomycetaceae bacterium]